MLFIDVNYVVYVEITSGFYADSFLRIFLKITQKICIWSNGYSIILKK